MTKALERFLGPRVPATDRAAHRGRYLAPTVLLTVAAALLLASVLLPYWELTLHAPQYPQGLHVTAYLNRLEGDVREIDGLNHYIGMRPLEEAAPIEKSLSVMAVVVTVLLVVAAVAVHTRWAALLALPALLFPALFLADLQYWLANFGRNLDPRAPFSSSVKPFIPPVLGEGMVGQFRTTAGPGTGLWLAMVAAVCVAAALYSHRRAYKPLVDEPTEAAP